MYPYGYGYGDPFSMLVGANGAAAPPGAGAGIMDPGLAGRTPVLPVDPRTPGLARLPYTPPIPYYPPYAGVPGCGPFGFGSCFPFDYCPPQSGFFYREAANTAVSAQTTQELFGVTTDNGDEPLEPGETRTATASPQTVICITRLLVPRPVSPFFLILSIKTGLVEHLVNGLIQADTLAVDSNHPPFKSTTLYPGMRLSVTVKNINLEDALHFYMTAFVIAGPNCGPCI